MRNADTLPSNSKVIGIETTRNDWGDQHEKLFFECEIAVHLSDLKQGVSHTGSTEKRDSAREREELTLLNDAIHCDAMLRVGLLL